MVRPFLIHSLGYGALLWLMGYALGMIFFAMLPVSLIGVPILAIMTPVTVFASLRVFKQKGYTASYYCTVSFIWLALAVVLDYVFLVASFHVENYYDTDVLISYALVFLIPLVVAKTRGMRK